MNNKDVKEQLYRIDSDHIGKILRLASIYKTTPLMILYGLIDKQINLVNKIE